MVSSDKATQPVRRQRPPAKTPEARENQLIAAATDLAERQIAEGTVSSQVLSHYLKLGSTRNRLEETKLRLEAERLRVQNEDITLARSREEDYAKVLQALQAYRGEDHGYDA
jgi:hypothetical protein